MTSKPRNQRDTARGIVIHENRLLLIERWRDGLHYFSIPGGGIENGEAQEEAAIREIHEETSLNVSIVRKLYVMPGNGEAINHIFLCNYISGEPALRPDSEEARDTRLGMNRFKPSWVDLGQLPKLPFLHWAPIRDQLVVDLSTGFSDEVKNLAAQTI